MQVEDLSPLCKTHSEVVESLFWHYAMSTKYRTVLNTKGLDNAQISLTWNEWLKAIRERLTLALQLNIECIEVESNVVIVVKFITNVEANNLALSTLVNDCKSMSKFVSIALKHI
ncbi:hypothetical protein Gotri_001344 [Gossypium trilobum]|uniref:RNase H type-1 domain-containing protein n=1 Tax=Gossypium trilobum TaxID=34281 RepID=A0A7J9FEF0_9ROSI|nr:hypothetical protein [Gossypium trilobum]